MDNNSITIKDHLAVNLGLVHKNLKANKLEAQ